MSPRTKNKVWYEPSIKLPKTGGNVLNCTNNTRDCWNTNTGTMTAWHKKRTQLIYQRDRQTRRCRCAVRERVIFRSWIKELVKTNVAYELFLTHKSSNNEDGKTLMHQGPLQGQSGMFSSLLWFIIFSFYAFSSFMNSSLKL